MRVLGHPFDSNLDPWADAHSSTSIMQILLAAGLAALLVPTASADELHPGMRTRLLSTPTESLPTRLLTNGDVVVVEDDDVDLYDEDGFFLLHLGTLPSGSQVGAFRPSLNNTFVLVGDALSGNLYRMWVDGSGFDLLGNLPRNRDASFENSNNRVLLTAATGTTNGTAEVWRLTLSTGALDPILGLPGAPGPLAVASDGDLFLAPQPSSGSTDVFTVDASDLTSIDEPVWTLIEDKIVVEVESAELAGDWVSETQYDGYTGQSYYRWAGADLFGQPGQGILTYTFLVEEAGNYRLRIRNRHQHPDSTLENDCWVRMDGHEWFKSFSGGNGSVNAWNWATTFDLESAPNVGANWDLTPGQHTLEISGRSKNFMIDRFHMYLDGTPTPVQADAPTSPILAPGAEVTDFYAGGFDGVDALATESGFDTLVVSESDNGASNQRIHLLGESLPAPLVLLDTEGQGRIDDMQLRPGSGDGFTYPFQPAGNGRVTFRREDVGTGQQELLTLEPIRPSLELSGPGTTGVGAVEMALSGAWPNGRAMLALDAAGAVGGSQEVYPLPSGLPLLFTPFSDSTATLLPFFLPVDANGELTFTFQNTLGLVGTTVFQYLIFDPSLELFGSSGIALY